MDVYVIAIALAAIIQTTPRVITYDWTNATITAGGATTSVDVTPSELLLPARTAVLDAYIVVVTQASGPTTLTASVGRTSATFVDYVAAGSIKAAAATTYGDAEAEQGTNLSAGKTDIPSLTTTTQLTVQFVSTGANLSTVTGSTGRVVLLVYDLPSVFALDNLTITAPKPFTFVRKGGTITVSGTNNGSACTIEASIGSGAYSTIASNVSGAFSGSLTVPNACMNDAPVFIRCSTNTRASHMIARISVGLVFLIMGQSNGSGFMDNNQRYTGPRRGALFANADVWGNLVDPTDSPVGQTDTVSRDTAGVSGAKGSVWPLFATLMSTATDCPVAIVPAAMGGTAIAAHLPTADHLSRATLYGNANARAVLVGGVTAALWWQGEADALQARTRAAYNADLDTLASAVLGDMAVRLYPCKLQNSSGITDADELAINNAIGDAWSDNTTAVGTGPDLSDLQSGDFYHVTSDVDGSTAASRWTTSVKAGLGL